MVCKLNNNTTSQSEEVTECRLTLTVDGALWREAACVSFGQVFGLDTDDFFDKYRKIVSYWFLFSIFIARKSDEL